MIPQSPLAYWLLENSYAIIYPLGIFHGPPLMLVSGFLVRPGILPFFPVYLTLIAADLTADIVWYMAGSRARPFIEKYGRFLSITKENLDKVSNRLKANWIKILFVSKITLGFGLFAPVVLTAAGAAGVPFKKYMLINFFGSFILVGIIMGAGYFLGNFYAVIDRSLSWSPVVAIVILLIPILYGFIGFLVGRRGNGKQPAK